MKQRMIALLAAVWLGAGMLATAAIPAQAATPKKPVIEKIWTSKKSVTTNPASSKDSARYGTVHVYVQVKYPSGEPSWTGVTLTQTAPKGTPKSWKTQSFSVKEVQRKGSGNNLVVTYRTNRKADHYYTAQMPGKFTYKAQVESDYYPDGSRVTVKSKSKSTKLTVKNKLVLTYANTAPTVFKKNQKVAIKGTVGGSVNAKGNKVTIYKKTTSKKKGKKVTTWKKFSTAKLKREKDSKWTYTFKTSKKKTSTGTYRIKVNGNSKKFTVTAKQRDLKVKYL